MKKNKTEIYEKAEKERAEKIILNTVGVRPKYLSVDFKCHQKFHQKIPKMTVGIHCGVESELKKAPSVRIFPRYSHTSGFFCITVLLV